MKLRDLLGKTFGFAGRALDSAEKLFDITDNLLDTAVAITEDSKQDVLADLAVNNKLRQDKLDSLGL